MDNYLMWARMLMDATDSPDATGYAYTYLMNGLAPESTCSRSRSTSFASVLPETYDVVVTPTEDRAHRQSSPSPGRKRLCTRNTCSTLGTTAPIRERRLCATLTGGDRSDAGSTEGKISWNSLAFII